MRSFAMPSDTQSYSPGQASLSPTSPSLSAPPCLSVCLSLSLARSLSSYVPKFEVKWIFKGAVKLFISDSWRH